MSADPLDIYSFISVMNSAIGNGVSVSIEIDGTDLLFKAYWFVDGKPKAYYRMYTLRQLWHLYTVDAIPDDFIQKAKDYFDHGDSVSPPMVDPAEDGSAD